MEPAQPFTIQFQPPFTTSPSPSPDVPSQISYSEMITAAIHWGNSQGKHGGSSKQAIHKYIDRVYNNLPSSHSELLTHHLKQLKNSGQLVMFNNSYQLPSFSPTPPPVRSVPPHQFPPPPQHPQFHPPLFHPPLFQPQQYQAQSTAAAVVVDQFATVKQKPVRPPKPQPQVHPVLGTGSLLNGSVKRRGRPPKNHNQQQQAVVTTAEVPFFQSITHLQVQPVQQPVDNGQQQSAGEKRGRGRPKKQLETSPQLFQQQPQQEVEGNVAGMVPKSREINTNAGAEGGGTSKEKVVITPRGVGGVAPGGRGRGRGRPRKNVVLGPVSTGNVGKRGRGWPKGRPRGKKVVGQGVRVALGLKRRGRPPKGTGGMARPKRVSRTGKTLGRPRKNALIVGKQASEQGQWMANPELLRKLEDMQLKIRDAVGTIRPCLVDQNAPDALTALQQLEDLCTMQITATPTETAPPVVTSISAPPPSTSAPASEPPPSLNVPPLMMNMNAPSLFNLPLPTMTVTEPLYAPSIGDQQPISWIQSSGAQS